MGKLILKLRLCFLLPPLSADPQKNEFGAAVEAWTEVLYGFVPAEKLEESYLAAMRNRKSTFPLGASEICAAYAGKSDYRGPVPSKPNPLQESCQDCFGVGVVLRSTEARTQVAMVCKHDGTTPREDSVTA